MQKHNTSKKATVAVQQVVAPAQAVATVPTLLISNSAPVATVVQPITLRAARVQAIKQALFARRVAAKQQQYHVSTVAAQQKAYMHAVQQLAAQYGLPVPNTLSVRSVPGAQKHAPSAQAGACAQVHAIAAQCNGVRSATLAACKAAGINPATAATQYAKYRKNNML